VANRPTRKMVRGQAGLVRYVSRRNNESHLVLSKISTEFGLATLPEEGAAFTGEDRGFFCPFKMMLVIDEAHYFGSRRRRNRPPNEDWLEHGAGNYQCRLLCFARQFQDENRRKETRVGPSERVHHRVFRFRSWNRLPTMRSGEC